MDWEFTEDAAFLALCDAFRESGESSAIEFLANGEGAFHFQDLAQATGRLHGPSIQPEKRLQQVQSTALVESFRINAAGPLLLAKAIEPALDRSQPFHFASLSARVGSIGDNRSGGWYAYRSAKAAQNMMLRCLSLEWARRFPLATVTLLHPGTTDTDLSKPFQSFVPKEQLFSPERAAGHLIDVLLAQTPENTGQFLAWDGQVIPW